VSARNLRRNGEGSLIVLRKIILHQNVLQRRAAMAMNAARARGYRSGLVDLATGQISREIFVN
jgi:hypothetical protein